MNLSWSKFQLFALVCYGFVSCVTSEPQSKNISQFTVAELGVINCNQSVCQDVTVVSNSEVIATTNHTLYLLEVENATTVLAAEETLQTPPSELHVVNFEGTISVAINHADYMEVYQYSRNSPSDGLRRRRVTRVYYDPYTENSVEYEPSSNVVVSARVRNSRLYINAVYIFENSWIIAFNPLIRYSGGFLELPADCSCNYDCQLQPSYNDRQGQVILNCGNDQRYLCNLYEEECFLVLPSIQWIVTSKVNRKLAVAVKYSPDLDQDLLLIVSFNDDQDTTYVTLASSKASVTHPGRIRDLAIVQIIKSDQEVACFLDGYNAIHCFVLNGVDEWPVIETVTLPPNVTVDRFQGATDSSLAVEVTFQSNQTFLMLVGIAILELGSNVLELNTTVCPNQTITLPTINPAVTTTKHAEVSSTTTTPPTTIVPTSTPDDNNTGGSSDSARRERMVEAIAISIAIVSVVFLVTVIGLFYFLNKYLTILRKRTPN